METAFIGTTGFGAHVQKQPLCCGKRVQSYRSFRRQQLNMAVSEVTSKAALGAALKEAGDSLVVIDFSTTWCGPCKVIAPKFEALSNEHQDVVFLKVIGDQSADTNEIMKESGIRSVPAFHYYKKQEKIYEVVGAKVDDIEAGILKLK